MTTEEANQKSSRQWRRAYLIRAIVLVLLAAAIFGGRLWLVHLEYVGGLNNSFGDDVWAVFSFYPVPVLLGVILEVIPKPFAEG